MTQLKSRKYQITINNPEEHGYTHEDIKAILNELTLEYWCMCDEVGESGTYHTHIFVYAKNAILFTTLQKRFYGCHIEKANGTSQENRDYIRKEGKYEDSEKKETNIIDTFEEFGLMPIDKKTVKESKFEKAYELIKDGYTNLEILEEYPSLLNHTKSFDNIRQDIMSEKYSNEYRNVEVIYISGETETGKTRFVLDKHGYSDVYKISNYDHPFDGYKYEPVILFDEFRSSLPLSDMLQYIDGYPCELPARYTNKQAAFTTVYIISNIPLNEQYPNIQHNEPQSFDAFKRRISHLFTFEKINRDIGYYDRDNISIKQSY